MCCSTEKRCSTFFIIIGVNKCGRYKCSIYLDTNLNSDIMANMIATAMNE